MSFFGFGNNNSTDLFKRIMTANYLCIIAETGKTVKQINGKSISIKYKDTFEIMKPVLEKLCGIRNISLTSGIPLIGGISLIIRKDTYMVFSKEKSPAEPVISFDEIEILSKEKLTVIHPELKVYFDKVQKMIAEKNNPKESVSNREKEIVTVTTEMADGHTSKITREPININSQISTKANELQIVDTRVLDLDQKEIVELGDTIDRIIESLKNNRKEINRLTFECVATITEAEDTQKELARKGTLSRWIGNITGTNQKLQNKINKNRSIAQYAAQQTLQKMEEQNLMTFELIAEVNNKLNKSLLQVDDKLKIIYERLLSFFVKCYDKLQEKQGLTIWLTTIRNQKFCDTKYIELDTVAKIVCIVRDFYDKTRGNWNEFDLPILETAIESLAIQPNEKVNYFNILCEIASNKSLKEKLLGNIVLQQVSKTEDLISTSVLKKYDSLENKDSFIVDTVVKSLKKNGLDSERKIVCANLTKEYSEGKFSRKLDIDVECFDLVLDLLENLKKIDERK